MLESIKGTLNKYVDFSGVASRSEYWTFYLFYIVAIFFSAFIGEIIGFTNMSDLVFLAMFVPLLSCGARKMHDVGKSGWFQLILFYDVYLLVQPRIAILQANNQ